MILVITRKTWKHSLWWGSYSTILNSKLHVLYHLMKQTCGKVKADHNWSNRFKSNSETLGLSLRVCFTNYYFLLNESIDHLDVIQIYKVVISSSNFSALMDCVGCEKCRLWGKLQVLGLGTALKILFSVDDKNHQDQPVSSCSSVMKLISQHRLSYCSKNQTWLVVPRLICSFNLQN